MDRLHASPLDLVFLVVFGAAVADGVRRGFKPYASELVALLIGLALAFSLFEPVAWLLERGLSVPGDIARLGAFLVLLLLGHGFTLTFLRRAERIQGALQAIQSSHVSPVSAVPALGLAVTLVAVLLSALAVLPAQPMRTVILGSSIGSALTQRSDFFQPALRRLLNLDTRPRNTVAGHSQTATGDDFYRLRLPSHLALHLDVAAENRMLVLVNQDRHKAGLPALLMDPLLQKAAREHSLDMYERAYFSHLTPENKTPFDRLVAAGVKFVTAGENIAYASNVDQAEVSLMASPEHRANLLNPDFQRVGIGIYEAPGGYQEMFTQDFADLAPAGT